MKRVLFAITISLLAGMYSCKQTETSNSGNTDNNTVTQKIKNDSLLNEANKLNSNDSGKTKKDSTNKTK